MSSITKWFCRKRRKVRLQHGSTGFADAASRQGYTRSSIGRRIRLAAGFSRWLGQEGIELSCIGSEHPAQYLRYRMDLLQAGVDRAVIALWLGHESGRDHADLSRGDASPHFSPRGLSEAALCAISVVRSITYCTKGARPHDHTV